MQILAPSPNPPEEKKPKKVTQHQNRVPGYSFSYRDEFKFPEQVTDQRTPGPAGYYPAQAHSVQVTKGSKFTRTKRTFFKTRNDDWPGPGHYDPKDESLLDQSKRVSPQQRISPSRNNSAEAKKTLLRHMSTFSNTTRGDFFEKMQYLVGPGSYEVKSSFGNNTNKRESMSIFNYQNNTTTNNNNNTITTEDPKSKTPQMNKTIHSKSHSSNVINPEFPGPGAYEIKYKDPKPKYGCIGNAKRKPHSMVSTADALKGKAYYQNNGHKPFDFNTTGIKFTQSVRKPLAPVTDGPGTFYYHNYTAPPIKAEKNKYILPPDELERYNTICNEGDNWGTISDDLTFGFKLTAGSFPSYSKELIKKAFNIVPGYENLLDDQAKWVTEKSDDTTNVDDIKSKLLNQKIEAIEQEWEAKVAKVLAKQQSADQVKTVGSNQNSPRALDSTAIQTQSLGTLQQSQSGQILNKKKPYQTDSIGNVTKSKWQKHQNKAAIQPQSKRKQRPRKVTPPGPASYTIQNEFDLLKHEAEKRLHKIEQWKKFQEMGGFKRLRRVSPTRGGKKQHNKDYQVLQKCLSNFNPGETPEVEQSDDESVVIDLNRSRMSFMSTSRSGFRPSGNRVDYMDDVIKESFTPGPKYLVKHDSIEVKHQNKKNDGIKFTTGKKNTYLDRELTKVVPGPGNYDHQSDTGRSTPRYSFTAGEKHTDEFFIPKYTHAIPGVGNYDSEDHMNKSQSVAFYKSKKEVAPQPKNPKNLGNQGSSSFRWLEQFREKGDEIKSGINQLIFSSNKKQ